MKAVFRRTPQVLVCSHCRRGIEPGQRFHVLTKKTGDMKLFCERVSCQDEMQKLVGQQSGGVKRPAKI